MYETREHGKYIDGVTSDITRSCPACGKEKGWIKVGVALTENDVQHWCAFTKCASCNVSTLWEVNRTGTDVWSHGVTFDVSTVKEAKRFCASQERVTTDDVLEIHEIIKQH